MKINQIQHYCTVNPNFHYDRPDGLDEYVLILAHGEAYFHSNGIKYLLKPNQLFIYEKYQPQLFYSTGEDFCHDWFHFDMSKEDVAFFRTLDIPFGVPMSLSSSYILSELIKMMASEHRFHAAHADSIIDAYMHCFFMKLSDMIHTPKEMQADHPHYQCLCELRNELYSFPYHEWSLETMSKKAFMSKSWLQHNWKDVFGISFQDDLIASRIEYAKNLLFHTNYSVERIAGYCGYNSGVHFMRQFKQVTGFTPSAYRKQFAVNDDDDSPKREFQQKLNLGDRKVQKKHT